MKTYVLTISEFFPKTHNKAGLPTGFINSISNKTKKHTIRGNYELWKKRFEKIASGDACLSVRYWTAKPYNSKQVEVFNFKNTDGISLEKLTFTEKIMTPFYAMVHPNGSIYTPDFSDLETIATNDGLSLGDFRIWFKKADLTKPMAIIHFTSFRYCL